MTAPAEVEKLLRRLAPQVLGALPRRHGDFDRLRGRGPGGAAGRGPGVAAGRDPQRPHGWQVTVASRRLLAHLAPRPMVTLNPVVALAVVRGPQAGLAALAAAEADPALAGHHRVDAVRAHLLELAGDRAATREQFRLAAPHRWTTGELPEQR